MRDLEKLTGFNRKFHRETGKDLMGVAIDNQADRIFRGDSSLITVKQLILRYF